MTTNDCQFFMGLNEIYFTVRSNFLLWTLLLTNNQTYSMVIQEKSWRGVTGVMTVNVVSSTNNKGRVTSFLNVSVIRKVAKDKYCAKGCEFCKRKCRVKDNRFKLRDFKKGRVSTLRLMLYLL